MRYFQEEASDKLSMIVKSFWQIDGEDDASIKQEKIIPDGYPEMIFHYKKPYRSNINGQWTLQNKYIIAGQITNHFFLENTGEFGMFAIKLQPWTLKVLFNIDMGRLTDQVVGIDPETMKTLDGVKNKAIGSDSFKRKIEAIEACFVQFLQNHPIDKTKGLKATQLIIDQKGAISVDQVLNQVHMNERTLERYFKLYIGLSPKFFSRIIRFAHIFKLVQENSKNWSHVTYQAGFYDQSHFIKNFKEFTGEDPSKYGFSEQTMANFFLRPA